MTVFVNEDGDLCISKGSNDIKIIAAQRDENEFMEASASWVQTYSSLLWKFLIEGSFGKNYVGKYNFEEMTDDIESFLEDIEGGI